MKKRESVIKKIKNNKKIKKIKNNIKTKEVEEKQGEENEEKFENNVILSSEEFHNFINNKIKSSPVLSREQTPKLEEEISNTSVTEEKKESEIKYNKDYEIKTYDIKKNEFTKENLHLRTLDFEKEIILNSRRIEPKNMFREQIPLEKETKNEYEFKTDDIELGTKFPSRRPRINIGIKNYMPKNYE